MKSAKAVASSEYIAKREVKVEKEWSNWSDWSN